MQFSDNIFAVNLHKEKNDARHLKLQCKNAKEGRLLSVQQREAGIYWTLVVGDRLLLVAKYWWLTLDF